MSRLSDLAAQLRSMPEKEMEQFMVEGIATDLFKCMNMSDGWSQHKEAFTEWVVLKSGAQIPINTLIKNIDDVVITACSVAFRASVDEALKTLNKSWNWMYARNILPRVAMHASETHNRNKPPGTSPMNMEHFLHFMRLSAISERTAEAGLSDWVEVAQEKLSGR